MPTPPKFFIPEGHRPEEFLRDAQLAEYHQWLLDEAGEDHPDRATLERAAVRARVAAALTAQAVVEHAITSEAEVKDKEAKEKAQKG